MRVAGSASITRISSPRTKSIAALEDNHDIEGRNVRRRIGEGDPQDRRQAEGGYAGGENVPHQSTRRAEGRGPAARRWLGRHAGAIPDRQENGGRRSRR